MRKRSRNRSWRGGLCRFVLVFGLSVPALDLTTPAIARAETPGIAAANALCLEFMSADSLRLDGRALHLDSLQQPLAARHTASPPELYRLRLPGTLEAWRVRAILDALRLAESAGAPERSCRFLPVALTQADAAAQDTMHVCVPLQGSSLMVCDSSRVRLLRILASGGAELAGAPIADSELAAIVESALSPAQDGVVEVELERGAAFADLLRVLLGCSRAGAGTLCLGERRELLVAQAFRGRFADCGAGMPILPFDEPAIPEHRQAPRYPALAKEAGVTGVVRVSVWIDEQGRAIAARALDPNSDAGLVESARTAALQWRFKPARGDGQAVAATMVIPFEFSLATKGK